MTCCEALNQGQWRITYGAACHGEKEWGRGAASRSGGLRQTACKRPDKGLRYCLAKNEHAKSPEQKPSMERPINR